MEKAYLYETHMHTSEVSACGASTGAEQARAYKARGYTGVIVTDHFINGYCACPRHLTWEKKMRFIYRGYEAVKKEGQKIDLDVFFGWEYAIHGTEFLTYGLGLDFLLANPGFDLLTVKAYSALVRRNGGYLAQAHPYREAYYIANPGPVKPEYIDGVEVFNITMPDTVNALAYEFAEKNRLAKQAGSDSHNSSQRYLSGITLNKRAGSIFDIISAIKAGEVGLI